MSCKRCGRCCRVVAFRVPIGEEDIWRWWKLHGLQVRLLPGHTNVSELEFPSRCYWYDPLSGDCLHYEDRPDICRKFTCEAAEADDKAKEG